MHFKFMSRPFTHLHTWHNSRFLASYWSRAINNACTSILNAPDLHTALHASLEFLEIGCHETVGTLVQGLCWESCCESWDCMPHPPHSDDEACCCCCCCCWCCWMRSRVQESRPTRLICRAKWPGVGLLFQPELVLLLALLLALLPQGGRIAGPS